MSQLAPAAADPVSRSAVMVGRWVYGLGAGMALSGLVLQLPFLADAHFASMTLERMYPGMPVWFMPESSSGYAGAAAVALAGWALSAWGRWLRQSKLHRAIAHGL